MKLTGDRCQCAKCGLFFNSTSAFDKHRTGFTHDVNSRRCLTAEEMAVKGMAQNAKGFWVGRPMRKERVGALSGGPS